MDGEDRSGGKMLTVREIMTSDVLALDPDLTLREAIEELRRRPVNGAPVVQGGRLVGVCSASDILEWQATHPGVPRERTDAVEWGEFLTPDTWEEDGEPAARFFFEMWDDAGADVFERFAEDGPEWDVLEEHTVDEVMSRPVCAVSPDVDVAEAARYMLRAGIHRVIVLDGDRLAGVVSTVDIVRAVAERGL